MGSITFRHGPVATQASRFAGLGRLAARVVAWLAQRNKPSHGSGSGLYLPLVDVGHHD